MNIHKLITLCTVADIDVWGITHPRIVERIEADHYELVVPDSDVDRFRSITSDRFEVIADSRYLARAEFDSLWAALPSEFKARADGYFQKVLKIAALLESGEANTCLIWESDALPLKKLSFIDPDGTLVYYRGREAASGNFSNLSAIASLGKPNAHGFVAQCLPMKGQWVQEFRSLVERTSGQAWIAGILAALGSHPDSEFSEYESLGTYALTAHPEQVRFAQGNWFRFGTALYANAANLTSELESRLCLDIDYICFERSDTTAFRGLQVGTGPDRIDKTLFGNRMLNTDLELFPAVDMTLDVTRLPWCIRSHTLEQVTCNSIVEHIDDVVGLFKEIDRCLLPGGVIVFAVPFIGSYNHGTDITHKRGFTFDSFNFLVNDATNYFYRYQERRTLDYRPVMFWRENVVDGKLIQESFGKIPTREESVAWTERVMRHEIPGSFGFVFQKAGAVTKA